MTKKESVRIKAFKARVIRLLEGQGWTVKEQPRSAIVDLITTRHGNKRAFIVKPHGHITRAQISALHGYSKKTNIGVVYIHESSECEILFSRLYKHLKRG